MPNMLIYILGDTLDPHLVHAAIVDERNCFNDKVWEIDTTDRMRDIKDHVYVRSRWELRLKGESKPRHQSPVGRL